MNPSPDEGQQFLDYTVGQGPNFNSLSSTVAGAPGVTSIDTGTELTASDNMNVVNNSDGSTTVSWFVPIVATLPVANLPLNQGQGVLVFWTAAPSSAGLYLYVPSANAWQRVSP